MNDIEQAAKALDLKTQSLTVRICIAQRDWEGVAGMWDTTGGMHGLPTIANEDRDWLRAEAARDGYDLDKLAEDDSTGSPGRPSIYGVPMRAHTIFTTDEQWQKVQERGGAGYIRQLIDEA